MKLIKLFLCVNIYLVKITEVLNLLSDLNQAEVFMSGLKEIIEKQNDENITLQRIVERLQDENKLLQNNHDVLKTVNEKVAGENVKLSNNNDRVEKEFRLKNSK